ncbi:hypothetical protein Tsubulata_034684 [Turnera subulata]|uniref:NYN domain-containing protein n=1 Tax=Turnera subulata TaxID=218843 RepID=A0A9Q0GHB7_9ROSI|nr:hypothetical protein Tsubulata_034684 [Turnera subulata]
MSGDASGGSAKSTGGVAAAEAQYVAARTSVWWDIENCQVPKGSDPHAIAQNISSALVKLNYCGPVSISAYGDTIRIPSSVQQALSSTGISLNHVPAGVKDASDKKILVDMLFWAVDNPAPANILLISGDRDFSNALHQLRMRRYNILLAQPLKASAPLVAAAKSVWLWTSLSAGGPPLTSGESSQMATVNNAFNPATPQGGFSAPFQFSQPPGLHPDSISSGNASAFMDGRVGDYKSKEKYIRNAPGRHNISRASSVPVTSQVTKRNDYSYMPEHLQEEVKKAPLAAPHEYYGRIDPAVSGNNFFPGNSDPLGSNAGNLVGSSQNHPIHPSRFPSQQHTYEPNVASHHSHGYHPNHPRPDGFGFPSVPPNNVLDMAKLSMSESPSFTQSRPTIYRQSVEVPKSSSFETSGPAGYNPQQKGHVKHAGRAYNRYARGPEVPAPTSLPMIASVTPVNGSWGTQGSPQPSEYVQSLIDAILHALNTLKTEKITPTEANLTDCIRFGDPKYRNTDVQKALASAIEHNMVMKQNLGALQLYVCKNERLWKCVNPIGGNPNQYPKATWDRIEKFLSSSAGRAAIVESHCRYEAAIILKNACLEDYALGEVLQILNIIISTKKWITHHQSGWRPIVITLQETASEDGAGIGA